MTFFCMVPCMIMMFVTQHCSVGHARGNFYCLPHMALPRLLFSSMFLALAYSTCMMWYTAYMSIYLLFVFCLHRMALITRCSVEAACMEEATNTYTCTIILCYHTLYSILILMCMNIAIAFICRSGKIPRKIKNLDS